MIDPGTGGGYLGTDWMSRDVAQIWQAIENQDTTAHFELLTGWQRSYELVLQHLSQVQNYRENLATAWPPSRNAAAAAYIERLDNLIAHLQDTYDAAVANHSVLSAATLAIAQARTKIEAIHREYASNQTKLADYHNRPVFTGRYAVLAPKPPVPDGRQEELNNQARSIMFGLSNEIIQAQPAIVKPERYTFENTRTIDDRPRGTGTYSPPPGPPNGADRDQSYLAPSGGYGSPQPDVNQTTSPSGSRDTFANSGLVLNNVSPTPTPAVAATPTVSSSSWSGAPPQNLDPRTPTFSGPSAMPGRYGSSEEVIKARATIGGEAHGPNGLAEPKGSARAIASGGVIGGQSNVGLVQPGRGRGSQRVNPIGGVVSSGENLSLSGRMGTRGASHQFGGGLSPGSASDHDNDGDTRHLDPADPWNCAKGVAPVLLPSPERQVDPGPAIGMP